MPPPIRRVVPRSDAARRDLGTAPPCEAIESGILRLTFDEAGTALKGSGRFLTASIRETSA